MEYIGYVVPFIVGGFFLWLAFLNFGKEKYPTSTLFGVVAALLIFCSFPWFQALAKTWLISNVSSKLKSLGDQIEIVQKTTADMHDQLSEHQKQIDNHQQDIGKSQSDLARQVANIHDLQISLARAQTNLMVQSEKLTNIEFRVNDLFQKMVTENIASTDTNKVCLLNDWGNVIQLGFKLNYVPVANSISAMLINHTSPLSPQVPLIPPFDTVLNVVVVTLSNQDFSNARFHFQYVKDTQATNLITTLSRQGTNVFLNGNRATITDHSLEVILPFK